MVSLGVTNSRMKDFYDVHSLSCSFSFDGAVLADAIRATFERRGTPVPSELPLAITRTFLGAPERQTQWRAFLRRGRLDAAPDASELADALTTFLGPPIRALANGERFAASWTPYRGWQRENKHLRRE
jgi:hypothetical protein